MSRRSRQLAWRGRQGFDRPEVTRPGPVTVSTPVRPLVGGCDHFMATIRPLDAPAYFVCIHCRGQEKRT